MSRASRLSADTIFATIRPPNARAQRASRDGTGKNGHGREKDFIVLEEFPVTETIVHKHG
ncbi:hypothetical protein [Bosea sp. 685]|uniref:hypothetical protein n=1 Tax=Bosea sp. 685 TaxID=3080057 RepID=UPI00289301C4|nr:hypothetical protein [Bosea sp. 685]WNJ88250.1 hypothetical protein RMR04_17695 [Bosea sp. 685]